MARNGSGTMSIINSFSANTTAESEKVNANFSDVASEITNSLPRDGQAAMTGQLKASTGTAATPSISFGSDTNTGFYRKAADTIGVIAGGVEVAEMSSTAVAFSLPMTDANSFSLVGIPTGAMMMFGATTAPTGWVRCNALTIGSAASGATERANADTEDLFSFLWTNYSDTVCAVSSGRGASAAADYAANKTIALPDLRGRGLFGLDDMGNSAASRLGSVITDETSNGASGGAETVTIDRVNIPSYTLPDTIAIAGSQAGGLTRNLAESGSSGAPFSSPATVKPLSWSTTTLSISGSVTSGGSDTPLANMPPAFLTTFIIKL